MVELGPDSFPGIDSGSGIGSGSGISLTFNETQIM